eukprot:7523257-Alexandrium_andersonii.AAC.1
MLVKAVQLVFCRCGGCATMADSPRGQGWAPSTGAHRGPLRATSKQAPDYWRTRSDSATWVAAPRRP